MNFPNIDPETTRSWKSLAQLAPTVGATAVSHWFSVEPERVSKFSREAVGLYLDFSKNRFNTEVFSLLMHLLRECRVPEALELQRRGERINTTENRAVQHAALRYLGTEPRLVDGKDVMPEIRSVRTRMKTFSEKIISGAWKGFTGKPIDTVVNIGIGGSDLGPAMAYEALKAYRKPGKRAFFISNVDGSHLGECLKELNAETTLFIIASKTFTTQETMANARSARNWFLAKGGRAEDIHLHFAGLTTNLEGAAAFGIPEENTFGFWDWVGGRYSLWSSIGLSLCCTLGYEHFEALLRGGEMMDRHVANSPLENNLPAILAATGIWYRNFLGFPTEAVLPYDQYLSRFPAYLQQANMESNGKRVNRNGQPVSYPTGPVVWGEPGTNGQHAFFQLLHQGTDVVPADFLAPERPALPLGNHHRLLLANFIAQTEALLKGKSEEEVHQELLAGGASPEETERQAPFRVFPGNRPSNTLLYPVTDAENLGKLIALYEYKIFIQGVVWNIYSFDQWGVELGKVLAQRILAEWDGAPEGEHDPSTKLLIQRLQPKEML